MSDDPLRTSRVTPTGAERSQRATTAGTDKSHLYAIQAESVETQFTQWTELAAFNPLAMARRFETLETRTKRKGKEEEPDKAEKDSQVLEVQRLEEISEQYEQKNPELTARALLALRARVKGEQTKEALLKKVLDTYTDYALADEALDFLIESGDEQLIKTAREVKAEINTIYAREIKAGRNIALQAREFSAQGLGSPTGLRDIYRDITGNPRDALTLFDQLATTFSYDKMKTVIDFVLHSLGADLKSKGPSISPGELHRLFSETRDMQAILGVFRFFKTRMNLILSAFQRAKLPFPSRVNFELLARVFMKYLQERYPSSDKVLQMAATFNLNEEEIGQIIVITQMRDAVRQVAPKLYRSNQHRQDVLMSFIEAIEDLEEEDEEEEKKDDKKKSM